MLSKHISEEASKLIMVYARGLRGFSLFFLPSHLHEFWIWFPAIHYSTNWLTHVILILVLQLCKCVDLVFDFLGLVWGNGMYERPTYGGMTSIVITTELVHLCNYSTKQQFSVFSTLSSLLQSCKDPTTLWGKQTSRSLRRIRRPQSS